MSTAAVVILFMLCQLDVSSQSCKECKCCYGDTSLECDKDETCEYGCIEGFYGDKCVQACRVNCKTCTDELTCTECHPGFQGPACEFKCGKGCVNNTCLQSGNCSCESTNFIDGFCLSCISGKHGDNCDESCPRNCGPCLSNTECSWCKHSRYYGSYCQFPCSSGCLPGDCYKNGSCRKGCKTSFTGTKCDSCVYGKHGPSCDLDCPGNCTECLSNSNCINCEPGYYGSICTDICPPGCNESKCDIKGICTSGCKIDNKYGNHCKNNCSKTCKNESCDWKTGHCLYGCIENHFGKYCKHECEPACQGASWRLRCNETNGHCFLGCLDGYHGNRCERKCSDQCLNSVCSKTTGACLDGCIKGYEGLQCLQRISQHQQEGHTTGEILGAAFGAGLIGVLFMFVFLVWRGSIKIRKEQRGNESHELAENETKNTSAHVYDTSYENEMPATYEALKRRDESNYSHLVSSQQESLQAADYINC